MSVTRLFGVLFLQLKALAGTTVTTRLVDALVLGAVKTEGTVVPTTQVNCDYML